MERMTYNNGKEWEIKGADGAPCDEVCENRFLSGCHDCPIQTAFDRLAAYEDTGLEPEDIEALQNREQGLAKLLANVSCGCAVPYTRLLELAQAEKDGRLVVLPCKPGTELFTHCHVRGAYPIAHSYFYPPYIPTLGENAWLTREEAEAAMNRKETDNEAD